MPFLAFSVAKDELPLLVSPESCFATAYEVSLIHNQMQINKPGPALVLNPQTKFLEKAKINIFHFYQCPSAKKTPRDRNKPRNPLFHHLELRNQLLKLFCSRFVSEEVS